MPARERTFRAGFVLEVLEKMNLCPNIRMREMICPRCDQQGLVLRVRINRTGLVIQLCDECDAMWKHDEVPRMGTFIDFGTYMESIGVPESWDELTILPDSDQKK